MKQKCYFAFVQCYNFYYTAQNFWKILLVNKDLCFVCLIKNAFSSDWLFIYFLLKRGDNYEELRGDVFPKTI